MLTVVRGDQLVGAVVWLAPLNTPLAVGCALRELVRPVHPINAGVDVVLVAGTNLEDAGNPVVVRPLPRLVDGSARSSTFLSLDAGVVGDINEALAEILDAIDYSVKRGRLAINSGCRQCR